VHDVASRSCCEKAVVSEQSCAVQRDFNSQQEWIQPTAVMMSSFYLCLEAQLTGEIAYAAFTQIVAILVLDYMTRPWNRVSMAVRSATPLLSLRPAVLSHRWWALECVEQCYCCEPTAAALVKMHAARALLC
jgi:hypothetical protein